MKQEEQDFKSLNDEEKQFYKDIVLTLKIVLFGNPNFVLPIWESMGVLGKKECLRRLRRFVKIKSDQSYKKCDHPEDQREIYQGAEWCKVCGQRPEM